MLALSSAIDLKPNLSAGAAVAAPMLLAFWVAALAEEVGWSGYATDPLADRWGTLAAGAILGVAWAVWHVIPYLQAGRAWDWIAWQMAFSVAARIILVRIYLGTERSLVAPATAHASINAAVFLMAADSAAYDPRAAALAAAGMAAVLALAPHRGRRVTV